MYEKRKPGTRGGAGALRGYLISTYMGVVLYPGCILESSEELIKSTYALASPLDVLIQLVRGRALVLVLLNTVPPPPCPRPWPQSPSRRF